MFGTLGSKPIHCKKHKSFNEVNVKHKLCQHENCYVSPSFGVIGTRKANHCVKHKEPEVNVLSKTCLKCDIRHC